MSKTNQRENVPSCSHTLFCFFFFPPLGFSVCVHRACTRLKESSKRLVLLLWRHLDRAPRSRAIETGVIVAKTNAATVTVHSATSTEQEQVINAAWRASATAPAETLEPPRDRERRRRHRLTATASASPSPTPPRPTATRVATTIQTRH